MAFFVKSCFINTKWTKKLTITTIACKLTIVIINNHYMPFQIDSRYDSMIRMIKATSEPAKALRMAAEMGFSVEYAMDKDGNLSFKITPETTGIEEPQVIREIAAREILLQGNEANLKETVEQLKTGVLIKLKKELDRLRTTTDAIVSASQRRTSETPENFGARIGYIMEDLREAQRVLEEIGETMDAAVYDCYKAAAGMANPIGEKDVENYTQALIQATSRLKLGLENIRKNDDLQAFAKNFNISIEEQVQQ